MHNFSDGLKKKSNNEKQSKNLTGFDIPRVREAASFWVRKPVRWGHPRIWRAASVNVAFAALFPTGAFAPISSPFSLLSVPP